MTLERILLPMLGVLPVVAGCAGSVSAPPDAVAPPEALTLSLIHI